MSDWEKNDEVVGAAAPSWGQGDETIGTAPAAPAEMALSEVPGQAAQHIIPSVVNFAKNITYPILHPLNTIGGLTSVGAGLISKAEGGLGLQQDPAKKAKDEAAADALGAGLRDRYGSWDALKNTMATDPVGFLADGAGVLTGGAALAGKVAGTAGKVGELASTVGKVGSAIDPLTLPVKALGKGLKAAAATTTGQGMRVFTELIKSGFANNGIAARHMRDADNAHILEPVGMAERAVDKMIAEKSAAYRADMGSTHTDPMTLDYSPIHDAIDSLANEHQYYGIPDREVAPTIAKLRAKVAEFHDNPELRTIDTPQGTVLAQATHTAEGMDELKKQIGSILESEKNANPSSKGTRAAGNVYNAVKAQIVKQVPAYADAMMNYSDRAEQLREIRKTLSLTDKATNDTTLRKLQSTMRDGAGANWGGRGKLLNELAVHEPGLPQALAGQSASAWAPRGLSRLLGGGEAIGLIHALASGSLAGVPGILAGMAASSPRIVGEITHAGAQAAGKAERGLAKVGVRDIPATARGAFQGGRAAATAAGASLVGGMGPRYDDNGNLLPGQDGAFQ